MKKNSAIYLAFVILLLATGSLLPSLSCKTKPGSGNINHVVIDDELPADQLITWRKPGRQRQEYDRWLDSIRKKFGRITEQSTCGSCDDALVLISGPGVKTFIQTDGVDGKVIAGSKSPTTGEDGPVYFCPNYRVRHKKPVIKRFTALQGRTSTGGRGTTVKVAVFDTGIDPNTLEGHNYQPGGNSCMPGGSMGWNFVDHNASFNDDDDIRHGTLVARFIADQVEKYGGNSVELLPVKTHDANGVGDLFDILCAMAYAQQMGVQVINASFGFYAPRRRLMPEDDPADPNILLLRKYIGHYLTRNHILLIAAAGNSDPLNLRKSFEDHGRPYRPTDPQDLDQVAFYPASLARSDEFPNVIAVTTVYVKPDGAAAVSPDQNFSGNVVDIGVKADRVVGNDFVFNNPLLNNGETVEGSSFAAPVFTGKVCAHFDRIKKILDSGNFRKEEIFAAMGRSVIRTNAYLRTKTKDGKLIDK